MLPADAALGAARRAWLSPKAPADRHDRHHAALDARDGGNPAVTPPRRAHRARHEDGLRARPPQPQGRTAPDSTALALHRRGGRADEARHPSPQRGGADPRGGPRPPRLRQARRGPSRIPGPAGGPRPRRRRSPQRPGARSSPRRSWGHWRNAGPTFIGLVAAVGLASGSWLAAAPAPGPRLPSAGIEVTAAVDPTSKSQLPTRCRCRSGWEVV